MSPDNVVPLLVLDSNQCHMMTLVVETTQQLGLEVKHIPVDVGIKKALKMLVFKDLEDWMLDSSINVSVVKPPTKQLIDGWVIKAFYTISVDTVQHSWRHKVYS